MYSRQNMKRKKKYQNAMEQSQNNRKKNHRDENYEEIANFCMEMIWEAEFQNLRISKCSTRRCEIYNAVRKWVTGGGTGEKEAAERCNEWLYRCQWPGECMNITEEKTWETQKPGSV